MNEHIANIGKAFEEFKKVNDQKIEEEKKGNDARAKELSAALDKISSDLDASRKAREIIEKKFESQKERMEILEAAADRPRNTVQDKIKSEHKTNLINWVRSGGNDMSAVNAQRELQAKAREVKDVSIGTTSAGGFALPEEISRSVDKLLIKTSQVVQFVKNVQAGTSDYKELISLYTKGDASNLYAWAGETSRSATGTPELRERTPTWGGIYAYPTATNWSLQDMFFNVENWLVESIAEGWGYGLGVAIWDGNGTNKPTGMTNTALSASDDYSSPLRSASAYEYIPIPAAASSPFTTTGITADGVIALSYQLNSRYRGNARFAANTITQGHIRRLKDTTGQYLWQPSLQVGQPEKLLGYELFTWEQMGNPTTSGQYPLAFGDFNKAYTLVSRPEMQMVVDKVTAAGSTKFYVERRVGGCVTNNDALKFLKVSLS